MLGMLGIIKKLKEAEEKLQFGEMSWDEYQFLKQASIGASVVLFFFGTVICAL
jgi:hypothetical protein